MSEKFQRVFRDRALSPTEVAADQEVRRQVQVEFPPVATLSAAMPGSLSDVLRQAIQKSGKSHDEIAAAAAVSPQLVARFLAGQRDIHMATADKIAESIGLKLAAN
jgi:hypothetical protein